MEKSYTCPKCGNQLLKVKIVEDEKDIEKYYCDICDNSYDESKLKPNKNVKLIKKTSFSKSSNKKKSTKKSNKHK
ncbi:MAG: hypothetical protein KBH94_01940 [Caldisericia bacterium]|jgi:transcription elongation factor Elf1|nr:hypothetical protein [Caldisericia bacterium]HOJ15655.1 hypothetical protein [Caldisericia bacterium]HOW02871.1 hypothetical protein [Caldisericia bacterium]HPO28454.1 hypothetical protein [Caldisericia bacterium]HQG81781.1 hypothetical protein [Caldisericia bacterium]